MYVEPDGTVWVGTVEGGLNRKAKGQTVFEHFTSANTPLSHNSVSVLAADDAGRLWIGTWGGGLNVIDLATKVIRRIEMPSEHARLTTYIGALAYDSRNQGLWIGSNDGVFFYDLRTQTLTEPFEDCQQIRGCIGSVIDQEGLLWIGCMQGVCIIDL